MYKIYSRKRLKIKNKGKITKIIVILVIALETASLILNYMNPIFEEVSTYEAKKIATFVSNEQTTKVMKNYDYDSMFSIQKDIDGKVSMIEMNMYKVNIIISDVAYGIQEQMKKPENASIAIPIGNFLGIDILSGYGPNIKMKIILLGNVETDLKSEFVSKGINQTLHRVYLQIDCNIQILSSYKKINQKITNQFLIAENIIVGEIPSTYYNLEGMESPESTMNVIN